MPSKCILGHGEQVLWIGSHLEQQWQMLTVVKSHWLWSRCPLCWLVLPNPRLLESSADLKCRFCFAREHERKVPQLLVLVASWLFCPHSCDSSSCFRMSFTSMRARSYKFKFDSDPSTTANVFRCLDLLEVNPVGASKQRAQQSTLRCEMRRCSILNAFMWGTSSISASVWSGTGTFRASSHKTSDLMSLLCWRTIFHLLYNMFLETFHFWRSE